MSEDNRTFLEDGGVLYELIENNNSEGHEDLWLPAHELSDEDLDMRVRNNFCWIIFDADG